MLTGYWPTAPELDAALEWAASRAPSPIHRAIAGVALRNPDLSIGGIRSWKDEEERWSAEYSGADLECAFLADRALMIDGRYDFEEQVACSFASLQMHPFELEPDCAFASNVQHRAGLLRGETLTMGAVVTAALVLGYLPSLGHEGRFEPEIEGDVFFEIPDLRVVSHELFGRRT